MAHEEPLSCSSYHLVNESVKKTVVKNEVQWLQRYINDFLTLQQRSCILDSKSFATLFFHSLKLCFE